MHNTVPPGYKQTEVGVIPEEWEVTSLGEHATFKTGPFGSALHKSDYTNDGVPVINPMHIVNGRLLPTSSMSITENAAKNLADFRLKSNEIIIGRRGDMGRCAVIQEEQSGWLCGTGSMIIRCGKGADPYFLQRILSSPKVISAIEETSVGSTMVNLNQGTLSGLKLQFPPLPEQRAIAAALSDVDALIGSLDKLIAKKRDMKQAAMQELLTGKRRLPGFSGEWEVKRLGDVADSSQKWSFTGGPFGSNLKSSDYTDDGVRIIQLQNIGDGSFINDSAVFTSAEKADELLSCNIYPGEVILSKMGDPVARACIIPTHHERYLMCSDGIRLSVNQNEYDTYFICLLINAPDFRTRAENAGTGSTRKRIGLKTLRTLELLCPPLPEQTAIATILSDMDTEIASLEQKRDKTRLLKQGMMQELLTGRIRLV